MHKPCEGGTLTRGADGALYLVSPSKCVRVDSADSSNDEDRTTRELSEPSSFGAAIVVGDKDSARAIVDPGDHGSARAIVDPGDGEAADGPGIHSRLVN